MSEELTTAEINDAWDRVARTSDGQIIYRHLMRLALALAPASNDDGALPRHEGGRMLARNLMSLMAEGITDSDRYCVAFVTRAREPERSRGAGRRVTADTFVPGYNTADYSGPGPGSNGASGPGGPA